MGILIGIGVFIAFLILLYIIGLIPNMYSNEIINPNSIGDIIRRGVANLFIICCLILSLTGFVFACKIIGESIIEWFLK